MSKEDFLARLKRLEENQPQNNSTNNPPELDSLKPRGKGQSYSGLFIALAVVVALAAGLGYFALNNDISSMRKSISNYIEKTKEELFVSIMTNLPTKPLTAKKEPEYKVDPDDPSTWIETSEFGYSYHSPSVLNVSGFSGPVTDILEGYKGDEHLNPSMTLINVEPQSTCQITRKPRADERVHIVTLDNSLQPIPLHSMAGGKAVSGVDKYLTSTIGAQKERDLKKYFRSSKMNLADVILTDSDQPIYLVLQTANFALKSTQTVWNLHLGPDVNLAHVVLIGATASGIANLPKDTTTEMFKFAYLPSGFASPFNIRLANNPAPENPCLMKPFRMPADTWGLSVSIASYHATVLENKKKTLTAFAEQHAKWFQENFTVPTTHNLVSAQRAAHVLVGPVPTIKVPYSPLANANVHIIKEKLTFQGLEQDVMAQKMAWHKLLLNHAASSGVGVKPAPILPQNSMLYSKVKDLGDPKKAAASLMLGKGLPDSDRFAFDVSGYTNHRRIQYTEIVEAEWLFDQYEFDPDERIVALKVKAHASNYMSRYCDDILNSIATSCHLDTVKVKPRNDKRFSISASFNYLPNYDVGKIGEDRSFKIHSVRSNNPAEISNAWLNKEYRAGQLLRLVEVCDALKQVYGNCVFGAKLSLTPKILEGNSASRTEQTIVFKGYFKVYAPRGKDVSDGIGEEVDALMAGRIK